MVFLVIVVAAGLFLLLFSVCVVFLGFVCLLVLCGGFVTIFFCFSFVFLFFSFFSEVGWKGFLLVYDYGFFFNKPSNDLTFCT